MPFALGYAYEADFSEASARQRGWTFDPAIFGSAPFFNGVGFVGREVPPEPGQPGHGQGSRPVAVQRLHPVGSLQDPNDDKQLYRYITGGLLASDGSGCNAPPNSKICFVNIGSPADMRFLESSGPLDLAPGRPGRSWWRTSSPRRCRREAARAGRASCKPADAGNARA